jgi:hypothetical protein
MKKTLFIMQQADAATWKNIGRNTAVEVCQLQRQRS